MLQKNSQLRINKHKYIYKNEMFILTCEYHTVVVHNINKNTYFGSNKTPKT